MMSRTADACSDAAVAETRSAPLPAIARFGVRDIVIVILLSVIAGMFGLGATVEGFFTGMLLGLVFGSVLGWAWNSEKGLNTDD
jgi:hypothetical protein